ncbi:MAG TPA: glycosyltransferase family 2 protein [Candidatus Paceibacterota bacterium]|nr:glycosyltransferase family 2 protein [Candidatus Paceibacterota bacterium]HRZ99771.1 glycosyltransferase family 2 protein [Candidatus Paceibacterota bacterium]
MPPELSVILPNYNHARFLPRCLDAMLAQSVPPREIIIIDDASTDNSLEVIDQYRRQHSCIRLHRHNKNQGVVSGMNDGLRLARGEYVYFAAADDLVLPGLFEKSLNLLSKHPQAALCCTIGDWHEESSGYHWQVSVGMASGPSYLNPDTLVRLEKKGLLYIASHTAIMHRQALIDAGGFLTDLRWHCDWFALYTVAFRHGICHIPEPLARYNIRESSFYKARRGDLHRQVIHRLLDYLEAPAYADVAPLIRHSGALFIFGGPILRAMLRRPTRHQYLNPVFLRKNLWHSLKLIAKMILPAFVAHWYFRTFYRSHTESQPHIP